MKAGIVLLDRYELMGRLGAGAISAVWEAFDQPEGDARVIMHRDRKPALPQDSSHPGPGPGLTRKVTRINDATF